MLLWSDVGSLFGLPCSPAVGLTWTEFEQTKAFILSIVRSARNAVAFSGCRNGLDLLRPENQARWQRLVVEAGPVVPFERNESFDPRGSAWRDAGLLQLAGN
jgi:hypothetical protein